MGNHLWLPVKNRIVKAKEGDLIGFDATISPDSILDPVRFKDDHQQHKVFLQVSLSDVVLRSD